MEYSSAFEVLNTRGKLKLGRKMLDYIINQSCDEKRVVDVAHVGHLIDHRYGKLIDLKTP